MSNKHTEIIKKVSTFRQCELFVKCNIHTLVNSFSLENFLFKHAFYEALQIVFMLFFVHILNKCICTYVRNK